jgi:hypothetical protein
LRKLCNSIEAPSNPLSTPSGVWMATVGAKSSEASARFLAFQWSSIRRRTTALFCSDMIGSLELKRGQRTPVGPCPTRGQRPTRRQTKTKPKIHNFRDVACRRHNRCPCRPTGNSAFPVGSSKNKLQYFGRIRKNCVLVCLMAFLHWADHIISGQRPPDPLQLELAHGLDLYRVLDLHQHSRTDEDLTGFGLIA